MVFPVAVNVYRINETRVDVHWGFDVPVAGSVVQMQVGETSALWKSLHSGQLSAGARSRQTWPPPNTRVRFRVSGGGSDWGYSVWIPTTPAPIRGLSMRRAGANLEVDWSDSAPHAQKVVQRRIGSTLALMGQAAWVTMTGVLDATVSSATIAGALSSWVQVRVVQRITLPAPDARVVEFPMPATDPVPPVQPPAAPTILSPLTAQPDDAPVVFSVEPNHPDTTAIEDMWIRYRRQGETEWQNEQTGTVGATTRAIALSVGVWEFQIQTKGWANAHGDWSPVQTVRVAYRPVVELRLPSGSSWGSSRPRAGITFSDPQGAALASWSAELRKPNGEFAETVTGLKDPDSHAQFQTRVGNGDEFKLVVFAYNVFGLESARVERIVRAEYVAPPTPTAVAVWDEARGLTVISVTNPASPAGVPLSIANEVHRRVNGGRWQLVWSNMPTNSTYDDFRVPLGGSVEYLVRALTEEGTQSVDVVTAPVRTATGMTWLHRDANTFMAIRWGKTADITDDQEVVIEQYLGDSSPTAHYGLARPAEVRLSGVLLRNRSSSARIEDLHELFGADVYYRDRDGRGFWAAITGPQWGDSDAVQIPISMTLTRVKG